MIYPLIVLLRHDRRYGFHGHQSIATSAKYLRGYSRSFIAISYTYLIGYFSFLHPFLVGRDHYFRLVGFFGSRWARTLGGRSVIDEMKMKAWPIGPLFMKMYMARFSRTGTTLVASGVPLIQMLEITSEAVDNVHIAKSLHKAIEKVKGGKSLSDSIEKDPNFLELVPNMLRIGEQSGALETMLAKVADYYEKEVDNEIKTISTIIEPVMMVIMGIMALTIVAAILLPIYGLVNQSGFTSNG